MSLAIDLNYECVHSTSVFSEEESKAAYCLLIRDALSTSVKIEDRRFLLSIVIAFNFLCNKENTFIDFLVYLEKCIFNHGKIEKKEFPQWKEKGGNKKRVTNMLYGAAKKYFISMGNKVLSFLQSSKHNYNTNPDFVNIVNSSHISESSKSILTHFISDMYDIVKVKTLSDYLEAKVFLTMSEKKSGIIKNDRLKVLHQIKSDDEPLRFLSESAQPKSQKLIDLLLEWLDVIVKGRQSVYQEGTVLFLLCYFFENLILSIIL